MFQQAFGVSLFTEGLKNYLETKSLDSAEPEDLYESIQKALLNKIPNMNVKAMMGTWETQGGFPLITISRNCNVINITQERFLYNGTSNASLWWIPLNYVTGNNPDFTNTLPDFWMKPEKTTSIRNETSTKKWFENDWILFNIKQTGYYRVNYDKNLWALLIEQLNEKDFTEIHALNRAQLIDDSINLAKAGILNFTTAFDVLNYMRNEDNYAPWAATNRALNFLNQISTVGKLHENFLKFTREITDYAFNKFGMNVTEENTNFEIHTRNIVIEWACKSGVEKCLQVTSVLLLEAVQGTDIHPDLQSVIYCNGLKTANETVFKYMLNKLTKSSDQAERILLMSALGCSQNATLLRKYLHTSLTNILRLQERQNVIQSVIVNGNIGLETSMHFIAKNAEKIKNLCVLNLIISYRTLPNRFFQDRTTSYQFINYNLC